LRDTDAAKDEILPTRLEARRRAIERHEQHGRQRRGLHRDPDQPHVVARERDQHRGDEQLIHAVVEAQLARLDPAVLELDPHVRAREQRGREADERRERDEEHVERVDEELLVGRAEAALADHAHRERRGRDQRREAESGVRFGRV
jgi:hypothetical protein